jgi:hypothetical protein
MKRLSVIAGIWVGLASSVALADRSEVPPMQPVVVPEPYTGCSDAILQRMQHTQEIVGGLVTGRFARPQGRSANEAFARQWAQRAQEQMNVQRDLARANPVPERELCHRLLTVIADQEAQVREMYGVQ